MALLMAGVSMVRPSPFAPKRRLVAGKNHYCESCGRRLAVQDASQRYRDDKKRARELFTKEQLKPAEIAARLEREEPIIRRWLDP